MKTICSLTLYDVMAEDMDVWITQNPKFGINLEIDDECGEPVVQENGIHPNAAECMADFCKRYLNAYENALRSAA